MIKRRKRQTREKSRNVYRINKVVHSDINNENDVYLTDIGIKRAHNICFSSSVSADNVIGFTIIQIRRRILE